MSVGHASRAEDQDSLLVLFGCAIGSRRLGSGGLGERLVDSSHFARSSLLTVQIMRRRC